MYERFRTGKTLAELTTLGIGGPAAYYTEAKTIEDMQQLMRFCSKEGLPFLVLGKGSNCLASDQGFKGLVIHNKIEFCLEIGEGIFRVGAGSSFSWLGVHTAKNGWAGLEFASGIPASVGGAVFMNAGANGAETADCLLEVEFIDPAGDVHTYTRDQLEFRYRHSPFQHKQGAIAAATFRLVKGASARAKQIEIVNYRIKTQPYSEKSAGCAFRNPSCASAGALIEQCGLKGLSIGGAKVSEKHANFIINANGASSEDVLCLINHIKDKVRQDKGIDLEFEIRLI